MKSFLQYIKLFTAGKIILMVTILGSIAGTVSAQTFYFDGNRKKQTLDFILIKNLIIIPLSINGKGPFNFILDTGVNPLIVTDLSIIDSLQLRGLKTTQLSGLGSGESIEAYLTNQLSVRVGNATMEQMPTAILKKDLFNLSGYVGMRIHGLIGFHFFNSFLVQIKYPVKRLVFALPGTKLKVKGDKVPIQLINNKPYMQLKVSQDGSSTREVTMIVDIGASHALSLEALDGKPFPLPPENITANLGVGFAGLINGHIGRLKTVQIGSETFKDVLCSFPDFQQAGAKTGVSIRNGNVGNNLLKHFDLTIDYANQAMYFKPNSYKEMPFEHDMSGMEVYLREGTPDLYFVGRIEKGSPADEAGIHTDDQLLSLNFKNITEYNLDDIDLLLKGGDGRRVIMQFARKDERLYKILILKRRI